MTVQFRYPPKGRLICDIPPDWEQNALTESDYEKLSEEFDLSVPLIKTVIAVESNGSGFLLQEPHPARPKILLESHYVYQHTRTMVSRIRSDLSTQKWTPHLYVGGSKEWDIRLLPLMKILDDHNENPLVACLCCSWGLGQVMGINYKYVGCGSIEEFVEQNHMGEYWQARHMMAYCKSMNLLHALRKKDWRAFARGYNGSGYAKNNYHVKLSSAYDRLT